MQQLISDLQAAEVGEILPNEPLANYTTWKIGGPADVMVIPKGRQQLAETIKILFRSDIPWMKIGKGSNMLVSDKGIRGVVIHLREGFDEYRFVENTVYAGASLSFITLSRLAGRRGLSGLEFAGGIPGTVGGAVYMNAGAHGSDVSSVFKSAEVVLETGELVHIRAEDLQFSYRYSLLHKRSAIVTEAVFQLEYGDRKRISEIMNEYKALRLRTQPLQLAVAGSVFRNPEHHYAAQLIEQAGLKGLRIGGAEISALHANFIINTGQATARDVLTLIEHIQEQVAAEHGIQLVPEVLMVGER